MATQESRLDIVMELAADSVESGLGGVGEMLAGLSGPLGIATVGIGAVTTGIGAIGVAAINTASDINAASNQMSAALGATDEEAANLNQTMQNIYANNFGESFEDIAGGIVSVEQAFMRVGDLSEEQLQQLTENGLALRDVYGVDIAESANAAATLVEEFGLTHQEAMDFITTGFQNGLNASDDFLDTIGEYSTQFSEGGASADQFFSLLESGMQGGMLGTDKAADAFKEFRVRIQDGSTLTAQSLEMIGINSEQLLADMANGTGSAADAWQLVNQKLGEVEDQNVLMQAGVGLLGTQFEDLGQDAAGNLSMATTSLADMAGATDSLNVKYNDLGAVGEGIWRQLELSIAPVGTVLLGLANDAMPGVQAAFTNAQPYIQQGAEWLGTNLPVAVGFLADTWNNQLYPAIVLGTDYFNTNVLPVLQDTWGFIDANLLPVIVDLGQIGFEATRLVLVGFITYWNEDLYPALEFVWGFVVNDLGPAWEWIGGIFSSVANTIAWISDVLAGMAEPPEWMMQMMGGGGVSAESVGGAATAAEPKGGGVVDKSQTVLGRSMGGLSIGNINISNARNYQEAYMGAVNGVRDELRARGMRMAA